MNTKESTNDKAQMAPVITKKRKKSKEFHLGGVPKVAVLVSMRNLYLMLKSGLALDEAVRTLSQQTSDDRLQYIYEEIADDIYSGKTLADSMLKHKKVFPEIAISIIRVGEEGGTLEPNLLFLADYLKKANTLGKKIKSALIYPAIVFALTFVEMLGVIFLILPKLENLFQSFDTVPPLTRTVLAMSLFVRTNAIFLLIGFIIFVFLFMSFLKTKIGRRMSDYASLTVPVFKKLSTNNILASFSRTLGILLETGTPLVNALEIATTTMTNSYYRAVFEKVSDEVKNGKNVADAMSKYPKYFPPTFVKMIEVGESTGSLETNLAYLYDYHAEEVEELSNNLTTLLEPMLLILIGGMIGLLALIIVGPIYQLTGSINA